MSNAMPKQRFSQIFSNLHLNDNAAIPIGTKDKLYKLRPFIERLNENL